MMVRGRRSSSTAPVTGAATREQFVAEHPYPLDRFQLDALDFLDDGQSVLVERPDRVGQDRRRRVRRPPRARPRVPRCSTRRRSRRSRTRSTAISASATAPTGSGLLTGDNSINGQAPIVVMTTEVLRNMIHAEPGRLADLRYVVLDEVHFLQDRYRGGVWEEVILGAPPNVTLVCLSATVANADQLAAWISKVRGATGVVIETHRPVELNNLFLVGDRYAERLHLLPTFVDGRPNPEAVKLDELIARPGSGRRATAASRPSMGGKRPAMPGQRLRLRPCAAVPSHAGSRSSSASTEERLLPAIYFVFSRAGCDESVRHCLDDGLRLTTPEERLRIRAIVESYVDPLTDEDLAVLGYPSYVAGLEAGVAAHHAGMVPPFREAVEACFAEALVKVVFATETLALGINMPARSVVIEEVTKVRRQRPPGAHAGRVHPAHRAGRPARHRRGRVRGGAVLPVPHLRRRRPHRRRPPAGALVVVPPDLQPGGQPRPPPHPRGRLPARRARRSPSS